MKAIKAYVLDQSKDQFTWLKDLQVSMITQLQPISSQVKTSPCPSTLAADYHINSVALPYM